MEINDFGNAGLIDFISKPQADWIACRWINVNGLSWDVIQALGKSKKLHRLAIEDMVNTNNRTKVDWYADHTFMVFTLQKLVHLHRDEDSDSSDDEMDGKPSRSKTSKFFRRLFKGSRAKYEDKQLAGMVAGVHDPANNFVTGHTDGVKDGDMQKLRTLQRYHGGPNKARMEYMERHSPLTRRRLAIGAEQVSIFLTSGNTLAQHSLLDSILTLMLRQHRNILLRILSRRHRKPNRLPPLDPRNRPPPLLRRQHARPSNNRRNNRSCHPSSNSLPRRNRGSRTGRLDQSKYKTMY